MHRLYFLVLVVKFSLAHREEWDPPLPEINNEKIEKGKPILNNKNYTKLQFNGLRGIIYPETFSRLYGVDEIRIFNSYIQGIESGALCPLESIKTIDLDFRLNDKPPIINRDTFRKCQHLEELAIRFHPNFKPKIPTRSFEKLETLHNLLVESTDIDHLTRFFLNGLHNLVSLRLDQCRIQQIDPDTLQSVENLKILEITNNPGLTYLPENLFRSTPDLQNLVLSNNRLTDINWREFDGLNMLTDLNLEHNRLFFYDAVSVAKFMPNLEKFSFTDNLAPCKIKEEFVHDLKANMRKKIEVIYKFGPTHYDDCKFEV